MIIASSMPCKTSRWPKRADELSSRGLGCIEMEGFVTDTLSLAMVFFYFQSTCQRILGRQFDQEYFQSIANVIRLEFPSLRKSLAGFGAPVDLRNTADVKPGYSKEQWLLILYCRVQFFSLAVRRLLRVGEKKAASRLTSVLQYFANVIGQRLYADEFGSLRPDYLVNR